MTRGLIDSFGRRIDYLRLSVTDRCNLRCTYCMPERMQFLPKADLLSLDEMGDLAEAMVARGIRHIRVTGGEPLVRPGLDRLMARMGDMVGSGLDELTVTTNAVLLADHAEMLARCGVRRVNVSLDTLDRETFARIARRDDLPRVLDGIAAAQANGLHIKLNTVALKGTNEAEIPAIVEWAHERGMDISLIEVMPLGDTGEDRIDQYLPLPAVRDALEKRWTLVPLAYRTGGPSRYVEVAETGGRLGFITPLTGNFCAGCNRIRVTATGQVYACLGGAEQVDLRAALREGSIDGRLDELMAIKPERHHFAIDKRGEAPAQPRTMSVTGG